MEELETIIKMKDALICRIENEMIETNDCEDCAFNAGLSTAISVIESYPVKGYKDE